MSKCAIPDCTGIGSQRVPKAKHKAVSEQYRIEVNNNMRICRQHADIAIDMAVAGIGIRFNDIRSIDWKIRQYTGLVDASMFEALLEFCLSYCSGTTIKYANTGQASTKIGPANELMITLKKFHCGCSDATLAVDHSLSISTVESIWKTWLEILKNKFRTLVGPKIPSLKKCQQSMPSCFATHPNTRLVIDCTELEVEVPKNDLKMRQEFFSQYKQRHTAKFLVGVSPNVCIAYVSEAYPGNTTDQEIMKHDKLLDQLEPGDGVMADKGFLKSNTLLPEGVTLNLPAGLHGKKKQYSEEEVQENDKIATARVHVERAIGYVKKYRILDNRINRRIVPYLKEIFEVCAHLTTMQPIHMRELDESTTGLAESVSALTL